MSKFIYKFLFLDRKFMKSRAIRRHHEKRIKRRVKEYYGGIHRDNTRRLGQIAGTRTPCSCWMCGNPRKYFNDLTVQERRLCGDFNEFSKVL